MVDITEEQKKKNSDFLLGGTSKETSEQNNKNDNFLLTNKEEDITEQQQKNNAFLLGTDTENEGGSIDDIVNSLEGTKAGAFMSKDWFNTTGKKVGNWFNNARHSITDKDNKRGIYDYSQYKEYRKAIEAAEESGEEVDRNAIYKSMAEEGIIDYDKFVSTIDDEYVDQYADFKKQLAKNKENFSTQLKNKLSPYMKAAATDSYKINNLTKAIEKMTNQRQMFVDNIMETYKDTRDPKLIAYINTVLGDYDNAIETFTSEWAKSLVYENRNAGGAYYDVLNDDGMRQLANTIQKIQYQAGNKMSRAAVIDNFRDSWQGFEHGNFIQGFGELVGGVLNILDFGLNQVGAVLEEGKQMVGGMYDVVEELNHLNAYADDANGFQKAFGSLGSWTMSIIDSLDSWGPAVIDLIVGEKVGTISKIAKAAKNADKAVDAAKQASWISKVISKGKFKGLVKVGETKGKQYLNEVLKDIFIYDVAFQQFEGHPLTTDEMTLNVAMNLPLDYMSVALNQGAKYFKPEMAADMLKNDSISLELVKKLEQGIKKGYSDKKLAEIYYIGKSVETNNPPKNVVKISEGVDTDKAELYKKIKEIQNESLNTWDRLTKFQGDLDDLITEMESRVSRKTRRKGSLGEQIDEYVQRLFNTSNMTKIFSDNVRIRGNIAFIGDLIDKEIIGAGDAAALKKAVFDAAGKNKQVAQVLYSMWLSDEKGLIEGLVEGKLDGGDVDRILQDTIKNLYKWNNKILDYGDFVNGFIKNSDGSWKNIFTGKEIIPGGANMTKDQIDEQIMSEIFQGSDFKIHTIELNNLVEISLLRKPDENGLYEIGDIFKNTYTLSPNRYAAIQGTPTGKMVDKIFGDVGLKVEKDASGNISIKATKEKLEAIRDASAKMRGKDWLSEGDSDSFSAFKIMFLDDYINSFNGYVDTLRTNKNLTQTELDDAVKKYKTWIEDIEDKDARELREQVNKNLKANSKKSTRIVPNKNLGTKQKAIITETIAKASNGLIGYTDAEAEVANQLWQGTVLNVKKAKDGGIDEQGLRQQFIELMDNVVSPSRSDMEDITNVKNLEGEIKQLKYQTINNSQMAKEMLADKMINFLRQFNYNIEDYQEVADVAGKFLGTISQSPLALKGLAESDNSTQFIATIFSRMLTDNEEALTKYLLRGQEVYRGLLENNESIKAFKSMGTEIENAITLARKNDLTSAKRADIINTLNKIQGKFDMADYNKGKDIISKGYEGLKAKVSKLGTSIDISNAKPEDIEVIGDFLAMQQMYKTGFYSEDVYKKLKDGFTEGLRKNKGTVRITDEGGFSYEVGGDVNLGVYMTNLLLGNLDDADTLAKVTIGHEFAHKSLIWDSRHNNVYIGKLTDNMKINKAKIEIQEKEFKSIGGYVRDYIRDLKDGFREVMTSAKPGQFNALYNTAGILDNPQELDELLNSLSEENIVSKLGEIAQKILDEKNASYLTKVNMINEALFSNPLFSTLDETITELVSMYRMTGEGYKGFDISKMNEVFTKAEHAAELIDRFRNMFFDSQLQKAQDFKDALRVSYNSNDIKIVPTAKELIQQKIFGGMLFKGDIPSKEVIATPNDVVNELWSRGSNTTFTEDDLYNGRIKLPKGKKLVFFDLETTGKKRNLLEGEEHPEVIQLAYKVVSNNGDGNKANVVSRFYEVSPEANLKYDAAYEQAKRDAKLEGKEKPEWLDPKEYRKKLEAQKGGNTTISEGKEFEELKKLGQDDNVIFVFHNGLQFDLPILNRLGAGIPETKCIDTLQLYKAVDPFSGIWKQEVMVKDIKEIQDALTKWTNNTKKEIEQHNAEYDTQELRYVFGYLYNHLMKNGKISEGTSADDIVKEMEKITMQMQRTKKGQYVKKEWTKDMFSIDFSKGGAEGLAEMTSKAIKLGDIDTKKPISLIKEDIIKSIVEYKNKIASTNIRNIININELDDMINTLRGMDSGEVITFAQMVDGLHHYEPRVKDIKRAADNSNTPSIISKTETEYYDYVDYNAVDGEIFGLNNELSEIKKVKDENIVNESIAKSRRINKTINDKLISKAQTNTVDVVETLQTLKGTLGEAGDELLNSLINHVQGKGLKIGADKLLVGEQTVNKYLELVKKGYDKDFNMFCLNRIFNNVLDLDESLRTEDFINKVNSNFGDRYDAIRNRLSRGRVISGDRVTNKDISILTTYIDDILDELNNSLYGININRDKVLKSYSVEGIYEFNRLIVNYMDAIKRGNVKQAENIEKDLISSVLSNLDNGIKSAKEAADIKKANNVPTNKFSLNGIVASIKQKLGIGEKHSTLMKTINAKTIENYGGEYEMLMMRLTDGGKEAQEAANDYMFRMYQYILYDLAVSGKIENKDIQNNILRLYYETDRDKFIKEFFGEDGVKINSSMEENAEARLERGDLLGRNEYDAKEYVDDEGDIMDEMNVSSGIQAEIYKRNRRADNDILNRLRTKYGFDIDNKYKTLDEWYDSVTENMSKEKKKVLDDRLSKVKDEDYYTYEFNKDLDFGLLGRLDTILDDMADKYNIKLGDEYKITENGADNTSRMLTINQGIFFKQTNLDDNGIDQLFKGTDIDEGKAISKFQGYNNGLYSNSILESINRGGLQDGQIANVTFSNGLEFKIDKDGIIKDETTDIYEILLSAINSLKVRGGTTVSLYTPEFISAGEKVYARNFWNSVVGKSIAKELGIDTTISTSKIINGANETYDEMLSLIRANGLNENIEGPGVLAAVYDAMLRREDTYLKNVDITDEESKKLAEKFSEEKSKHRDLVQKIKGSIESQLEGTMYDVGRKDFVSDIERFKSLKVIPDVADNEAQFVQVVDTKGNVIEEINSSTHYYPLYRRGDDGQIVLDSEFPSKIKESKREKKYSLQGGKPEDIELFSHWNRGNRQVVVEEIDGKPVIVSEIPMKDADMGLSVYKVKLNYVRKESPYQDKLWDPISETYKEADEEVGFVEGKYQELSDLLLEREGIDPGYGRGTFEEKRGLTEAYEDLEPHYGDNYDVIFRDNNGNLYYGSISKTKVMNKDGIMYNSYNIKVDNSSHFNENKVKPRKNQDRITYDVIREVERRLDEINNSRKSVGKSKSDLIKKEIENRINSMSREDFIEYYNKKYAKEEGLNRKLTDKESEELWEEVSKLKKGYGKVVKGEDDYIRKELEKASEPGEFETTMSFNSIDGGRRYDSVHKELETDDLGAAILGGYYKYDYDEEGKLVKERVDSDTIFRGTRVNGLDKDSKEFEKILKKQQQGRYKDMSKRFKSWDRTYKRYQTGNGPDGEIAELNKNIERVSKNGNEKSVRKLTSQKADLERTKKILDEGSGETPVTTSNNLSAVGRQLAGFTNKTLVRDDKTIRNIVGERNTFLQVKGKQLDNLVQKRDDLINNRSDEQLEEIFDAYKRQRDITIRNNDTDGRILLIDISDIDKEADELINEFAKIMNFDGNWKNISIMKMFNKPKDLFDIVAKTKNSNLIAAMGKMNWSKQDVFEYVVKSGRTLGITDAKRLTNMAQDFVGDPLGVGNWTNALANLRSMNRFLKYSVPAPISGTLMLLNGTLLGEQMYRAKKKGLSGLMDNPVFEKICLNENLLKVFNRGEDIVLHGNTDMDVGTIAFDRGLKNVADALTKEGTKARELAETIILGGIHSLQDLTYNAKVRVLAFAQALQQKGITELQLDDILKKIESGEMFENKEFMQAWNDIMAMTEYYYDDFFTNSATAFMSRNKFSRLWIFNNLQGYVIKRSDEIGRAITGFKNWLAAKPKGAHYSWGDFVDHLETNQELKAFLNNVLLSTKLAFYLNRADMADGKDGDNLYRYAIEANDYLSSLPATFFYQLLSAPFKGYEKYKKYQDITGDEGTLADGTSVVLMNTLSQICSQFFRESKPLMALMDTAVAYGKTGDLGFANSVLGTDLAKISNGIGRFGLVEGLEKYGLEDFSKASDMIGQILLAGNETTNSGRSIQDSYDVTFVDNVLNDKNYAFISALGNLPILGELIKETTDKGGFTFNEAKQKELSHMMDNDKVLQDIYKGKIDADMFDDDAIGRIYNDFVSFNYPYKSLKSMGKHSVGTIREGIDTTLNSMKEDVFVQNICEKLNMSIEDLHDFITKGGYDAKTVGKLKMMAAAEAAEPGSGKIILSYMAANRLYELEKQATGKSNPSTADIPEGLLTDLKRQVIQEFSEDMFVADRTSQYKVMREYISKANPGVFKSLKSDDTIQGYANTIGFLDMLVRQAALDGDCNAKYFKNIFSVAAKYVKDDAARLALMRHVMTSIDETDLDPSAKMIGKEGVLAGNIEIYNKVKDNEMFRALHPGVLEDFEHRIWGIQDYINITGGYRSGYNNGSYSQKYGTSNDGVQDQVAKQIAPYTNPFSKSYVPRGGTYGLTTPRGRKNTDDTLDFYLKLYEKLIQDYSDKLVKSEGKKYPAEKIAGMTYKSGRSYGFVKPKQLYFPKHKQQQYSTKTISNLPGASG